MSHDDMPCYDTACHIVRTLNQHGFIAYFAGGWVRDFLMKHPSDDIDIATDATPADVQKIFEKTIPVGIQFGIIIVVLHNHQFEIATFRKDHGYEDGRRPIGVEKSTPEEDAKRRDFTINGMFYDPIAAKLIDLVEGREDLDKKIIRAIGNPHERFLEDRLRMIRAVRYACRFQFVIEEKTRAAICNHANALFPSVAIERIWQEFYKMRKFGSFKNFILQLHELSLLQTIFPELETTSYEEIARRLTPLDHFPSEAPLIGKILELFPNSSLGQHLEICEKFKLSNQDKEFVKYYHPLHTALQSPDAHLIEPHAWAYLYANPHFTVGCAITLARLPKEEAAHLQSFHQKAQAKLSWAIDRIRNKDPLVKSHHLLKEGISPGITMGLLLKEGEKISINQGLQNPQEVIGKLKTTHLWP